MTLVQELLKASDSFRDSENAGMIHITKVLEIVRAFADKLEGEMRKEFEKWKPINGYNCRSSDEIAFEAWQAALAAVREAIGCK